MEICELTIGIQLSQLEKYFDREEIVFDYQKFIEAFIFVGENKGCAFRCGCG